MNKRIVPLYRGQSDDIDPSPTLSRETWYLPKDARTDHTVTKVSLSGDQRDHYWQGLSVVADWVMPILDEFGLPRRMHLDAWPAARWAVIAHYELWPTPLLDFSTSVRVAASFALKGNSRRRVGYVYLAGVSRLRSDLMDLIQPTYSEITNRDKPELDREERRAEAVAMRLDAVCPPSALRAHLQSGVLVGNYPFQDGGTYIPSQHTVAPLVIAAFKLIDDGTFWHGDTRAQQAFLLPQLERDPLLARFRESFEYRIDGSGRIRPQLKPPGRYCK
jgi:hypothetical protein